MASLRNVKPDTSRCSSEERKCSRRFEENIIEKMIEHIIVPLLLRGFNIHFGLISTLGADPFLLVGSSKYSCACAHGTRRSIVSRFMESEFNRSPRAGHLRRAIFNLCTEIGSTLINHRSIQMIHHPHRLPPPSRSYPLHSSLSADRLKWSSTLFVPLFPSSEGEHHHNSRDVLPTPPFQ